jgi:hypothetical protein
VGVLVKGLGPVTKAEVRFSPSFLGVIMLKFQPFYHAHVWRYKMVSELVPGDPAAFFIVIA